MLLSPYAASSSVVTGTVTLEMFGAIGDGVTDDTPAWNKALAAVNAQGGGAIQLLAKRYAGNFILTGKDIQLDGYAASNDSAQHTQIIPYDLTKPGLQIGNDSLTTTGITIRNIGNFGNLQAQYGLKIFGASYVNLTNCVQSQSTVADLWILGGSTIPNSYIFFTNNNCNAQGGATSVGLEIANGGQYSAAVFFENSNFHSASVGQNLWAIRNTGCVVYFTNCWFQFTDGQGLRIQNTSGSTQCIGSGTNQIDTNSDNNAVLVSFAVNNSLPYLIPGFEINGKVTMPAGTTAPLTGFPILGQSVHTQELHILGELDFEDNTDPSSGYSRDQKVKMYRTSSGGISIDTTKNSGSGSINLISGAGIVSVQRAGSMPVLNFNDNVNNVTSSIKLGAGAPSVSANPGSIYLNTLGGVGTTLYVKQSGTGSSGWASVA